MSEKDDLFSTSSGGEQTPLVSPGRDMRKLKKNSAATAGEMKALLAQMKGKSAGEVLGAVAASDLGKSLLTATAGAAVLIVVFTAVPYLWGTVAGDGGTGGEGSSFAKATEDTQRVRGEAEPTAKEEVQAEEVVEVDLSRGEETVEKLGIGETMEAPADVNPLEGATDDLLKDLD